MSNTKFNLPRKKFDEIIRQGKKLTPAKCNCGASASITVRFEVYGACGVRVECNKCKRATKYHSMTEFIGTEKTAATPVTGGAILKAMKKAVRDWANALAAERIKTN